MKPGISVQHSTLPTRRYGVVRCDVAGIIGLIPRDRWPQDAASGDFLELTLRRTQDLLDHPLSGLFGGPSCDAVQAFFANGGDTCVLFGVCIENEKELGSAQSAASVLAPLIERLRGNEEIALLAIPAVAYLPWTMSHTGQVVAACEPVYKTLLAHCREMTSRFLILDAPLGMHDGVLDRWFEGFRTLDQDNLSYGAIYYPWLQDGQKLSPPSGSILGVFARVDRDHQPYGVIWPPANVPVSGVTHPQVPLTWGEAQAIAATAINPILTQPGRGVLVFGARTMSRDPNWEFINSRRIASLISEQLRRDNEWVVFETNRPDIWKILARDVRARLDEFWERGMLTGAAAGRDYWVKCDEENNPRDEREQGRLNVMVRIRPVSTAEHITIDLRLSQADPR